MNEYTFKVVSETGAMPGTIPGSPANIPNPISSTTGKTLQDGIGRKLGESAMQKLVVSPLNQATGGLASPIYQVGKSIVTGGSAAAIGAGLAGIGVAAVMFAISKIEERMAKMEAEAEKANNRDNALIRAGSVSSPTYYKATLFGVKVDRG